MAEVTISKNVVIDYPPQMIALITRLKYGPKLDEREVRWLEEMTYRINHYLNQGEK